MLPNLRTLLGCVTLGSECVNHITYTHIVTLLNHVSISDNHIHPDIGLTPKSFNEWIKTTTISDDMYLPF